MIIKKKIISYFFWLLIFVSWKNLVFIQDNFDIKDSEIIVFDIETTGLAKTDEIVQVTFFIFYNDVFLFLYKL